MTLVQLSFPINTHQNAKQMLIGSVPAYWTQCTFSPPQPSFSFFEGLVPRLLLGLVHNYLYLWLSHNIYQTFARHDLVFPGIPHSFAAPCIIVNDKKGKPETRLVQKLVQKLTPFFSVCVCLFQFGSVYCSQ